MNAHRCFVAGATGFTGREVVRLLREQQVPTTAHVRPDSSSLERWRERFAGQGAEVDTTAWETDAMRATLSRLAPSHVFCLVGTTARRGRGNDDSYETVDYGLTKLLCDAAAASSVEPRFVYLSALGADSPRGAYLEARHRAEQAVMQSGLIWTIARPSFITGDRDEARPGETVGAAATDAGLRVASWFGAGKLRQRYRSTDADTLARALVRIALDPACADSVVMSEDLH